MIYIDLVCIQVDGISVHNKHTVYNFGICVNNAQSPFLLRCPVNPSNDPGVSTWAAREAGVYSSSVFWASDTGAGNLSWRENLGECDGAGAVRLDILGRREPIEDVCNNGEERGDVGERRRRIVNNNEAAVSSSRVWEGEAGDVSAR